MFKIRYTLEYANGGWKYFDNEFNDREEFRKFVREIKNNPKCIGYVTTNTITGIVKYNERFGNKWLKGVGTIC